MLFVRGVVLWRGEEVVRLKPALATNRGLTSNHQRPVDFVTVNLFG